MDNIVDHWNDLRGNHMEKSASTAYLLNYNTLEFKQSQNVSQESETNQSVIHELFQQYEQVVVKSLVTSFGLDALLINDQNGGDVDTIHNVRNMIPFKKIKYQRQYDSRGDYRNEKIKAKYHQTQNYRQTGSDAKADKLNGVLSDAYTGKAVKRNAQIDIDHTISAKEIHDDPARILAGITSTEEAAELATRTSNLNATDRSINRSKQSKTMSEFLNKNSNNTLKRKAKINELQSKSNLTDKEREQLYKLQALENVDVQKSQSKDKQARKSYDAELNQRYYLQNPQFALDTLKASGNLAARMGVRQVLGVIFAEVLSQVHESLPKITESLQKFDMTDFLKEIAKSFQNAFTNVKLKYKELLSTLMSGAVSGFLSSISTTLINIFFSTATAAIHILRESWASITEAVKILVFNPDNLPFGEVIRSVGKLIATAISVTCGILIQEAITKLVGTVPIVQDVLPSFLGTVVSGALTVTLLYFMDHSPIVQKIVEFLNEFRNKFDVALDYFDQVNTQLNEYVSKLAEIDYASFEKQVNDLHRINQMLDNADNVDDLNTTLFEIIRSKKIHLPFNNMNELDHFMNDPSAQLIF